VTRDSQAERYRAAAEATLSQVEWCVSYLHRIRKPEIAESIDKNRRFIQQRMNEDAPRVATGRRLPPAR
jgi:hypothetical protein